MSLMDIINPNPPEPPKIHDMYCSYLPIPDRVLIRYDIYVTNYTDDGLVTRIYRNTYPVIGETAASWFFDEHGQRRHVLKGDGKRYCHETEEMALYSLKKRTRWRQSHAHWALTKAHEAIDAYNALFPSDRPLVKAGQL